MHTRNAFQPTPLLSILGSLAIVAGIASVSGVLSKPPPQVMPLTIWLPIVAAVLAVLTSARARAYVMGIPAPLMIAVQAVRAPVGVWFLVQGSRGALPEALAGLAGVGDLVYGLASFALLLTWSKVRRAKGLLAAWNILGLLEILAVNVTAMRFILFSDAGPQVRELMTSFPVVWIPLLLVPCVICSHFLFFAQMRAAANS